MKLTKDRLKSLIGQEITNSIGFYGGELSKQRKNALKFYLGEKLGNEVEGQSQVRSQDILEVVESILPSMMRMVLLNIIGKQTKSKKRSLMKI